MGMRALLLSVVAVAPGAAAGQNYEPIRVDFGLVGGHARGISEGGFGGLVEPKLVVGDHLAVGLRVEGMVTFGASVGGDSSSFGTGSVGLLAARGEYLVGTYDVRPVLGFGFGLYAIGGDTVARAEDQVLVSHKSGNYAGASPALGIEFGRVRLAVTYHILFGADITVERMAGGTTSRRDFSQNYLGFELSFHAGGSRMKRDRLSAR
jgi:hypothetical protein